MVARGKGLLAADESLPTIEKRFKVINLASTPENHRLYRELLFTTPGLNEFISGVILFDETIRQKAADGRTLVQVLTDQGIIPGIKVDEGAKPLAGFAGEKVTAGLDGLRERFAEYRGLGARFSKWRAVIAIGKDIPTSFAIEANAHALARFAALSQEAELVPIVEPEVLMDGDHSIERCEEVTMRVLERVFEELAACGILFENMVLKPNMVIAGKNAPVQADPGMVARATVRCLRRRVPAAVPGIVFLSGGQTPQQASENLNAIGSLGAQPWELTFSYGRALQDPVIQAWRGNPANIKLAQQALYHRARCNSLARDGKYSQAVESESPKTP
jgi:fructose-bisphosphate aldolase class I